MAARTPSPVERTIADGGADRRAAGHLLDASGDGVGGERAERPLRRDPSGRRCRRRREAPIRLPRRRARWRGTGSMEQPAEHAATTAPAAATARGAAVVGGRGIGPLEAPEIVTRGGRPLPHLAQLNLVLVAVGIGDDDRDSLPVPLRGRVSPGMRFDGDDLIRARVDDGDIFEARNPDRRRNRRRNISEGRCP